MSRFDPYDEKIAALDRDERKRMEHELGYLHAAAHQTRVVPNSVAIRYRPTWLRGFDQWVSEHSSPAGAEP